VGNAAVAIIYFVAGKLGLTMEIRPRAELVHVVTGPDFLGLILIALRGAMLLCSLRRTRNQ
jgi:hypothetical protein